MTAPPERSPAAVLVAALITLFGLAVLMLLLLWLTMPRAWAAASAVTAASVGVSSATVLPANTASGYRLLVIDNESTTATVACTLTGTAALNTAGSFTIPPQAAGAQNRLVIAPPENLAIREPLNCIASGAATPVSVLAE